jgi:HlyD family secretion protein
VVVGKLLVEEGDRVQRGQAIALLDNHAAQKAAVDRLSARVDAQIAEVGKIEAELRTGRVEYGRLEKLHQEGATSESQLDVARLSADSAVANLRRARAEIALARADLRQAQEELELTTVRAPVSGQVLKIHTREGEKAGIDGIAELADTEQMYAVAEVYETDLSMIHVGQRATVTVASGPPLSGVVERVGLKVGKLDVLGTDPVAKTDARVVEVEVRLDDSSSVRSVTNMQVVVSIDTQAP